MTILSSRSFYCNLKELKTFLFTYLAPTFGLTDSSTLLPVIKTEVTLGYSPVTNANVTAIVETDAHRYDMPLRDSGVGADSMPNDGVYAGYFIPKRNGRYRVKIKVKSVEGQTKVIVGGLTGAYNPAYVLGGAYIKGNCKTIISVQLLSFLNCNKWFNNYFLFR
jgi:hypothetical protein